MKAKFVSKLVRVTDLRTGLRKTFFPWEPRMERKRYAMTIHGLKPPPPIPTRPSPSVRVH